jgi:hypothetical protein
MQLLASLPSWLGGKTPDVVQGILRRAGGGRKHRKDNHGVSWLPELTAGSRLKTKPSFNPLAANELEAETELRERWLAILRLTRLPSLT